MVNTYYRSSILPARTGRCLFLKIFIAMKTQMEAPQISQIPGTQKSRDEVHTRAVSVVLPFFLSQVCQH